MNRVLPPESALPGETSERVPAWGRRELPSLFSVEETARRVGTYKWIEMKVFEVLGGWVALSPELEVKMQLGTHCYRHSFHAELWHKRLPELGEMNPQRLTAPANGELESFFDQLNQTLDPEQTIERLTGIYRVLLPGLITAYSYHLKNTSTITDAPTMRILELCLRDDIQEWQDGEMLLQSLLLDALGIDRAADWQAELAKLLLEAGGIVGPESIT